MGGRRVVVVRHGERVDFVFTEEWLRNCFDSAGNYRKNNLNMPDEIVTRQGSPRSFVKDCPLTQIGKLQGILVGKGLSEEKALRDGFDVYVSPSLRCIETAVSIGKGMGVDFDMKIEPSLFEWTSWFPETIPTWLTIQELQENGINVDASYSPMVKSADLKQNESLDHYYERSYKFIKKILAHSKSNDVLVVAHGATLDTATRQLMGYPIRSHEDFMRALRGTPYCAVAVVEESVEHKKWALAKVPNLNLSHTGAFDYFSWLNLE